MSQSLLPTRRSVLAGLAATAAAPALAKAPMMGMSVPKYRRVMLGGYEVTTLLAGTAARDEPQKIFGQNVSAEEFAAASQAANIPADRVQFFFTPVVVNTGDQLVLFDTGLNPQGTGAALQEAGYSPDQVDTVVITHMHGDHVGGLMDGETETFANAAYVTGRVEYDHWAKSDSKAFDTKVRPLSEKFTFVEDGGTAAPGVTAMAAFGHTPGHMTYMLESEGRTMLLAADFANHYVWSLAHPDWEVRFDMDKSAAAATRRRMLDMLASTGTPFSGYHMPFPATGYVVKRGDGYAYEPSTYQLML
ncbi:MBL fold metallo-hydrolase [Pseudaestuariivita atlantica]|uniref:Metallo-beta-lactamase n=1 Tax=Pseudaestuariivita atlantica TaxID=1317121 RepID=A0A0L1JRB2_9RHOB|nr:MBL fold metallo-hydrolase [Pseudaestuariivita atlantica]KNG94252.1 metallo-beta-lactamase [Pseudaestuariivita atlantica]